MKLEIISKKFSPSFSYKMIMSIKNEVISTVSSKMTNINYCLQRKVSTNLSRATYASFTFNYEFERFDRYF